MYSYDERIKAVKLYIQYDKSYASLFRELGYETPYQDGACFCVHSTYSHFSAQDINRLIEQNMDRANLAFCAVENTHSENSLYENLELHFLHEYHLQVKFQYLFEFYRTGYLIL